MLRRCCILWVLIGALSTGLFAQMEKELSLDVIPAAVMQSIEKAYKLNKKGLDHLDRNDLQGAYSYFVAALDTFPGYTDAKNNIGVVYYRRGLVGEAQRQWRELTKAYPTYFLSYFNLATAALQEKRFAAAYALADSVIALNKNFYRAHVLQGHVHLERNEPDKAVDAYKKACAIAPKKQMCWSNYAYALTQAGDTTKAVDLLRAHTREPVAARMLGTIYDAQGKTDTAIELYRQAFKANRDSTLLLQIAHTRFHDQQYCKAYDEYTRYFAFSGQKTKEAFVNASYAARMCKSDEAARRLLQQGYTFYPDDPVINYNLGMIALKREEYGKAHLHLGRAADSLSDPHLYFLRGQAYFTQGQYEKALTYTDKAVSMVSRAPYYDLRGRVYYQMGDTDKALQEFDKALAQDSSFQAARLHRALVTRGDSLDDFGALISHLEQRLSACSTGCHSLRHSLAFAYFKAGRMAGALQMLEKISSKKWSAGLYTTLAAHYREQDNTDSAAAVLLRCVKGPAASAACFHQLAELYIETGRADSVAVLAERYAGKTGAQQWKVYYQLGHAYLSSHRLEDARRALEKSLKDKPGHAPTQGLLAFIHARRGDRDTAQALWRRALQQDSENTVVLKNIGLSHEQAAAYDSAMHYYRRALQRSPDDSALYINMGNVYAATGDTARALQMYENALASAKRLQAAYNIFVIAATRRNEETAARMRSVLSREFPQRSYTCRMHADWKLWHNDTAGAYETLRGCKEKTEHDYALLARIAAARGDTRALESYLDALPDSDDWSRRKARLRAEAALSTKITRRPMPCSRRWPIRRLRWHTTRPWPRFTRKSAVPRLPSPRSRSEKRFRVQNVSR
jgi:tetratricopeptide (TPR) repeat protein